MAAAVCKATRSNLPMEHCKPSSSSRFMGQAIQGLERFQGMLLGSGRCKAMENPLGVALDSAMEAADFFAVRIGLVDDLGGLDHVVTGRGH